MVLELLYSRYLEVNHTKHSSADLMTWVNYTIFKITVAVIHQIIQQNQQTYYSIIIFVIAVKATLFCEIYELFFPKFCI